MSWLYSLDTNIIFELLRSPNGPLAQKLARVGDTNVAVSIIVAGELRFGAIRRANATLSSQIDGFLEAVDVMPLDVPADRIYGELRTVLERAGTPVGANDLLIAAQALAGNMTVVTDNEREFSRVPGLKIENWLRV
jgi:tRNA(fMet)-specific endonuclease VapC